MNSFCFNGTVAEWLNNQLFCTVLFLLYRKYCVVIKLNSTDSYRAKKRSAVDRTAAEWSHVANFLYIKTERGQLII